MYKVYNMISDNYYTGHALIAARSAAEANEYIANFKTLDFDNKCDSYGWTYVTEDDVIEYLSANQEGLIYNSIRYCG